MGLIGDWRGVATSWCVRWLWIWCRCVVLVGCLLIFGGVVMVISSVVGSGVVTVLGIVLFCVGGLVELVVSDSFFFVCFGFSLWVGT